MRTEVNNYNDLLLEIEGDEPLEEEMLLAAVHHAVVHSRPAVWLTVPAARSELLKLAYRCHFVNHHCRPEHFVLNQWLSPQQPNRLPSFAPHLIRVEGVCLRWNATTVEVLMVKEKSRKFGRRDWKLPSGAVENGEFLGTAIEREMKEEVNLSVRFLGLLGLSERLHVQFDRNEILFCCLVVQLQGNPHTSSPVHFDTEELSDARWLPVEYLLHQWARYESKTLQRNCLLTAMQGQCTQLFVSRWNTQQRENNELRAHYLNFPSPFRITSTSHHAATPSFRPNQMARRTTLALSDGSPAERSGSGADGGGDER